MVRVAGKLSLLLLQDTGAVSVDSIGHRRLRPESAFTFPEQAARFQREGYQPFQKLIEPHEVDVILKRFQPVEPRGSLRRSARNRACAHKLRSRIGSPDSNRLYMTAEVDREAGAATAPILM